MRNILLSTIVMAYILLGCYDLYKGNGRTGVASIGLALVNGLLFWRGV